MTRQVKSVDFNDVLVEKGIDATKDIILDQVAEVGHDAQIDQEIEKQNALLNPPPVLAAAAYHGFLKDIVEVATAHSEASQVAVASNVIALFCASIGRVAYQDIGDGLCHARPFFLHVGKTGKARKGTAEHTPRRIFQEVGQLLGDGFPSLKRHDGGLSTGEGLGWVIRDPIEGKGGDNIDDGVSDKRLMVVEAEFAGAMAAASREKNNLSAIIRTTWDGRTISPLVKNAKWSATDPHVVLTGHITAPELIEKMTAVDAQSGFMNRFIILHVARPKLVPLPKRTPNEEIKRLAVKIAEAVEYATNGDVTKPGRLEVRLSPDAARYWTHHYPEITKDHDGIVGALLVRSEIYTRMLAMIFALFDQKSTIERVHIDAALAWVNYWQASVRYIFQTLAAKAESEKLNETSKTLLEFITKNDGCTRTAITSSFRNKLSAAEITTALNVLLNSAPPLIKQETKPRPDGKAGKGTTVFYTV
ncbi:DUF3987 domain-containing protein [Methylomarinum sp. Ch1-1]|uniref:DUF3987 domain-containing protein n=1 Tax=Methylomarinum roseum TaxID=3067653 RepID=A0AAU7NSV6_9GAMM|nr:DUF3987 domain-containing protein [Methylomarinum sp. Ch1-1]MDP4519914.1 DUF3987 domain-containing protein [Methylomarinum sp. Ch1-1]